MGVYRHNYGALDAAVLNAAWMEAHMRSRAERIKAAAEAIAPVGPASDPHAGRYKASFGVRSGFRGGGDGRRAWAETFNNSPEAVYVEFGTSHQAAQHILGRALDAAR